MIEKFLTIYGTQKFITTFKEPATGPYSEPDESSPHLPTLFP